MSGYVDLQVNGYAGVDFNSSALTVESMVAACKRIQADGTTRCLATIITAPLDEMCRRITRIASWIETVPEISDVVAGLHVEGPFLSSEDGYVGAHPVDAVLPATVDRAQQLLDSGDGRVKLMTLAPEQDVEGKVTRYLTDHRVLVAAGHCDPSMDQLKLGIDNGMRMFTHLGNACPASLPRHDNVIQRVLRLSDRLMVSFIADGHHVPLFALRNYLRCVPPENVVIVTDAISAAGLGPGTYELSGQVVTVDEDGAAWAPCRTHFAGCAMTFPEMARVLREGLGVGDLELQAWMNDNPTRLLSLTNHA